MRIVFEGRHRSWVQPSIEKLPDAVDYARRELYAHAVARKLERGEAAVIYDGDVEVGRMTYHGWAQVRQGSSDLYPNLRWEPAPDTLTVTLNGAQWDALRDYFDVDLQPEPKVDEELTLTVRDGMLVVDGAWLTEDGEWAVRAEAAR